jgi:hypothetical protein
LWRPRWFDATALVVGAAAPDLQQAAPWLPTQAHHWTGFLAFSVPFTVVYCIVLRRYVADGLFSSLPDAGPLRMKSYRVLRQRRPRLLVTVTSACLGAACHIGLDSFTHANRWGSDLLGISTTLFTSPRGDVSGARVLQYLGHTLGTLIGVALFTVITSRGHLASWYGAETVERARNAPVAPHASRTTAITLAVSGALALAWLVVQRSSPFFVTGFCLVMGLLVAGAVNQRRQPPQVSGANSSDAAITSTT